jgi:hypothetical protein
MKSSNTTTLLRGAALAAVGVLMLSACTTLKVGTDHDPAADFEGYKTFTIMQRSHQGISNPLIATRAADAIKADLLSKGFVQASDAATADFVVDFTIGARDRTDVTAYPDPYVGPRLGWGAGGWWGGSYWGSTVDVRQYREGTLSVDVFDTHSHRPVWHGWAKKDLTRSDIEKSAEAINKAVQAVLDEFPPA